VVSSNVTLSARPTAICELHPNYIAIYLCVLSRTVHLEHTRTRSKYIVIHVYVHVHSDLRDAFRDPKRARDICTYPAKGGIRTNRGYISVYSTLRERRPVKHMKIQNYAKHERMGCTSLRPQIALHLRALHNLVFLFMKNGTVCQVCAREIGGTCRKYSLVGGHSLRTEFGALASESSTRLSTPRHFRARASIIPFVHHPPTIRGEGDEARSIRIARRPIV